LVNWPDYVQNGQFLGAYGQTTAAALKDAGLELSVNAPSPATPSMTMAIDLFLQKNNKK